VALKQVVQRACLPATDPDRLVAVELPVPVAIRRDLLVESGHTTGKPTFVGF
jgi:hypothetical protein